MENEITKTENKKIIVRIIIALLTVAFIANIALNVVMNLKDGIKNLDVYEYFYQVVYFGELFAPIFAVIPAILFLIYVLFCYGKKKSLLNVSLIVYAISFILEGVVNWFRLFYNDSFQSLEILPFISKFVVIVLLIILAVVYSKQNYKPMTATIVTCAMLLFAILAYSSNFDTSIASLLKIAASSLFAISIFALNMFCFNEKNKIGNFENITLL